MSSRRKLGLLTPSSNTILEPRAAQIISGLDDISLHFSRFEVKKISMRDNTFSSASFEPQLRAADLLVDAKIELIAWGGTSGAWVGIETDRELCRQLTERCGTPATTTTLALLAAFEAYGVGTYSLVTPYVTEIQNAIQSNLAKLGYSCLAERHLNDEGNYSFADYDETLIERMVREVAVGSPDAIVIYCTNFDGTRIAPVLEQELKLPVLDSISLTLWHSMGLAGCDMHRVNGWGDLFSRPLP